MLTIEEKELFKEIFDHLGTALDITETEFNGIVRSYDAVGKWLAQPNSTLAPYKPVIRPQGSFMLGTMIKPICDKDDLDIDLVCELSKKPASWTQYHLKQKIGDRLKLHEKYRDMMEEEGRRCWVLKYADSANYHMDILPSIVCDEYDRVLNLTYSYDLNEIEYSSLAIRITDKLQENYYTETATQYWMKSNPFGFGRWFYEMADIKEYRKHFKLSDSVKPIPQYNSNKLPLQKVVQILKRHRDRMFTGDEDKPISIIITTLAARAYRKETDIMDSLMNVVSTMRDFIEQRFDPISGKIIKWVENPVNPEENFADKWVEYPQREKNFYRWLDKLESDLNNIIQKRGMGLHVISNNMKEAFGENTVNKVFSRIGELRYNEQKEGALRMAIGTGILGNSGEVPVKSHNFHGNL